MAGMGLAPWRGWFGEVTMAWTMGRLLYICSTYVLG